MCAVLLQIVTSHVFPSDPDRGALPDTTAYRFFTVVQSKFILVVISIIITIAIITTIIFIAVTSRYFRSSHGQRTYKQFYSRESHLLFTTMKIKIQLVMIYPPVFIYNSVTFTELHINAGV